MVNITDEMIEEVRAVVEHQRWLEEQREQERKQIIDVRYYACDCAAMDVFQSKYCDDHHTAYARIPLSILKEYTA